MSSGPPATPRRLPFRSLSVLIGELGGTMMEPSAVVKGEKVKSPPPLRSRETHNQSVAMMSTEPACRPTVVAWVLANGTMSSSMPSALSRPLARMVSSAQLTVPNFSTPIVTLFGRICGLRKRKAREGTDQQS